MSSSPLLYLWSWSLVMCGHLRCCTTPHQTQCGGTGCYQVIGSCHQQWWLNTLPETSNIGYQSASFYLSMADSLGLCAIYCVTSFSFLLIMRPLKWKVCLPSVISRDLTASLKVQRKITAKNTIAVRCPEQEGVRHTQQIALKQILSKTLLNLFLASFSKEISLL